MLQFFRAIFLAAANPVPLSKKMLSVNFLEIDIVLSLDLPSTIIKLFFSTFNKHVSKTSLIFYAAFNVQTAIQVFLFFLLWGFWTFLQTTRKLYKSKGFNYSFWNDL